MVDMDDEDYQMFKIVVIGDSGTGKTNITTRFVNNQYADAHKATVGVEFLAKVIRVHNSNIKITFWDTAGQERYKSLSKVYYKGAAGIIIVYDVTNQTSYANVESWMRLANQNLNISEVKIIVVGNKVDDVQNKKVDLERAKADYKDRFDIDCFETSAKTGFGVNEAVMCLVEKIWKLTHDIKGTTNPFSYQEDDDDDGDAGMGTIVQNDKVSKPVQQPKTTKQAPPADSNAFKKNKKTEQKQKNGKAQTGKNTNGGSKPKKSQGVTLNDKKATTGKKDKSCC